MVRIQTSRIIFLLNSRNLRHEPDATLRGKGLIFVLIVTARLALRAVTDDRFQFTDDFSFRLTDGHGHRVAVEICRTAVINGTSLLSG